MLRPKSTLRYTPDLEEIAEEFIEKKIVMKRNNETKEVNADFLDDLYKWALESVTCLALNARLGCLESDIKEELAGKCPTKTIKPLEISKKSTR